MTDKIDLTPFQPFSPIPKTPPAAHQTDRFCPLSFVAGAIAALLVVLVYLEIRF